MTTAWKWMSSIIEVFKSFKKTRLNLLRNEKKNVFHKNNQNIHESVCVCDILRKQNKKFVKLDYVCKRYR